MISSKKIWLLGVLLVLLAPCSLLHAQIVVPKRDIQPVDSLNRTRPQDNISLNTVKKKWYGIVSRADGYWYDTYFPTFLIDSLHVLTTDALDTIMDTNFGNTDITFTGTRIHDADGYSFTLGGLDNFNIVSTSEFGEVAVGRNHSGNIGRLFVNDDGPQLEKNLSSSLKVLDNYIDLVQTSGGYRLSGPVPSAPPGDSILTWESGSGFVHMMAVSRLVTTTDSVFSSAGDSLCFIQMGVTHCEPLDSIIVVDGELCYFDDGETTCTGMATGVVRISDLLGANKANVIDNANYTQEWRWPTLGNGTGIKLNANGSAASGQAVLRVYQTGGGSGVTTGIDANNTNTGTNTNTAVSGFASGASFNFGVAGSVNAGIGVYGSATTGTGVHGTSSSGGVPIRGQWSGSSTNTMERVLDLFRYTDGTAANGIGSYMTFSSQNTGEASGVMTTLASRYVNASYATRTSQFLISGIRSGVDGTYATISGDSITLDTTTFHIDVINNRLGIRNPAPARTLDVRGITNIKQSASLNSLVINGGNTSMNGNNNQIIGVTAGNALTSGAGNILLGLDAGKSLTTGSNNICIGERAGAVFSSQDVENLNISIGYFAGFGSGGDTSICIGALAGGGSDMDGSVLIGYNTGDPTVGGAYKRNTIIGHMAGSQFDGGSGNVLIGYKTGAGQSIGSNKLWIDNSSTSTPLIKGDFSADSIRFNGIARAKILRDEVIIDGSSTSLSLSVTTSVNIQTLKASGAKTVTLPNATSSTLGYWYKIVNNSTSGDITVSVAGGSSDTVTGDNILSPGESGLWRCVDADLWDKD